MAAKITYMTSLDRRTRSIVDNRLQGKRGVVADLRIKGVRVGLEGPVIRVSEEGALDAVRDLL
jgi:hypothetical protein